MTRQNGKEGRGLLHHEKVNFQGTPHQRKLWRWRWKHCLLGWWLLKGGLKALFHSKAREIKGTKGSCFRRVELGEGWETKGEELEVYLFM
jgi:hypothetical protein